LSEKWLVLKFGGTSVAGRPQWEAISALARGRHESGYRVLLVCSAVAGVTDLLTALSEQPESPQLRKKLLDRHLALAADLGVEEDAWLAEAVQLMDRRLARLAGADTPEHRAGLLVLGEWLSTRIGQRFLAGQMHAGWVDAREALEAAPEPDLSESRQWLEADCRPGKDPDLVRDWRNRPPVLVTQGFIARMPGGSTALLGRGGSDTSAALFAGRLEAERLEIWTDVPGLFSADPRLLETARLLREVTYAEALEMAAGGAKVVHPRCIRAAAETSTPVVICDVSRPEFRGTAIGATASNGQGIKTVTCKKSMAVMLLQNLDARRQVGFLAAVFDVFRQRGISVDQVATSETTTTVALDRALNHLTEQEMRHLESDLSALCTVKSFADCVCVNLVGRGARTALGRLQPMLACFSEAPLLMASQSANDLCLSLLVRREDHERILRAAHQALIPPPDLPGGDCFGETWQQWVAQS
jgi:diaminopimelate decarboxylase/aspartate kinase